MHSLPGTNLSLYFNYQAAQLKGRKKGTTVILVLLAAQFLITLFEPNKHLLTRQSVRFLHDFAVKIVNMYSYLFVLSGANFIIELLSRGFC